MVVYRYASPLYGQIEEGQGDDASELSMDRLSLSSVSTYCISEGANEGSHINQILSALRDCYQKRQECHFDQCLSIQANAFQLRLTFPD
jgi:hypothetical protein